MVALSEDLGSIPSTHTATNNCFVILVPRNLISSLASMVTPFLHYKDMFRQTPIHKIIKYKECLKLILTLNFLEVKIFKCSKLVLTFHFSVKRINKLLVRNKHFVLLNSKPKVNARILCKLF